MIYTQKDVDRFYTKVLFQPGNCWLWLGGSQGYGRFYVKGKHVFAHRFAYLASKGEITEGLHVDHLCRMTTCVNPYHLEAVTPLVNLLEGVSPFAQNKRKTHCKRGHLLEGDNVVAKGGNRSCRACACLHTRLFKASGKGKTKLQRNWYLAQQRRVARLEVDPWSLTPKGANGRWKRFVPEDEAQPWFTKQRA